MRLHRRHFLHAPLIGLLAPRLSFAAEAMKPSVRMHDHGASSRLVLELAAKSKVTAFQLAEPYRLVVDLEEASFLGPDIPADQATALIKAVRAGLFQPGQSRVVVDLTGPVAPTHAFLLAPTSATPWRLVFDLAPVAADKALIGPGKPFEVAGVSGPVEFAAAIPPPPPKPTKERGKKLTIAVDPGHGGIDPGAIGKSGIYEKNITLAAAQQLKAKLEATGRYRVVLTRARDTSLGLRQRIDIARHAPADAFISLHADSVRSAGVRGLSVYTLSEKASDAEAGMLAESENKSDLIIGMDLGRETQEVRNILIDLAQRESMNLAAKMATLLIGELRREVALLRNTHRFAGFAVLKAPDIPSVLVEMGYLSNKQDEAALKKEAYRGKLMTAVVKALDQYFAQVQVARRA
ncbi:MAG: N-acetylmuramoyl-L-alanine amidase [Alphaproteobacteria bacterium]|nr:N-acetylmuramoyl-L-alanine amidase [Alphaproteobacteria bacterium]